MADKLNSREALYGFVGWLTSREGPGVKMGSSYDCAGLPDLIEEFSNTNNFDEVTEQWPTHLIHPSGEVAKAEDQLIKGEKE